MLDQFELMLWRVASDIRCASFKRLSVSQSVAVGGGCNGLWRDIKAFCAMKWTDVEVMLLDEVCG